MSLHVQLIKVYKMNLPVYVHEAKTKDGGH